MLLTSHTKSQRDLELGQNMLNSTNLDIHHAYELELLRQKSDITFNIKHPYIFEGVKIP